MELLARADDKLSLTCMENLLSHYKTDKLLARLFIDPFPKNDPVFDSGLSLSIHNPNSDKSIGTNESLKVTMKSMPHDKQKRVSKRASRSRMSI